MRTPPLVRTFWLSQGYPEQRGSTKSLQCSIKVLQLFRWPMTHLHVPPTPILEVSNLHLIARPWSTDSRVQCTMHHLPHWQTGLYSWELVGGQVDRSVWPPASRGQGTPQSSCKQFLTGWVRGRQRPNLHGNTTYPTAKAMQGAVVGTVSEYWYVFLLPSIDITWGNKQQKTALNSTISCTCTIVGSDISDHRFFNP